MHTDLHNKPCTCMNHVVCQVHSPSLPLLDQRKRQAVKDSIPPFSNQSIMQAWHMSLSASADTTCLLCTHNHSTSLLVPQMQCPSCINSIPPGLRHGTSFLNWHMRATVHSRFSKQSCNCEVWNIQHQEGNKMGYWVAGISPGNS